uniref:INO80 complex subunit B-like conserved region domain-containing protein n=1 Tax=Nyssomyia neivai TaxID=330878 RepID=A0A1L8DBX3_9DIPT
MKVRKKRDLSPEEDERKVVETPVTPRQKEKRHKKKKKRDYDSDPPVDVLDIAEEPSPRTSEHMTPMSAAEKLKNQAKSVAGPSRSQKRKRQRRDSGTSSDEERWLEKIKDPKMMTARQRAMYERGNEMGGKDMCQPEVLVALPTGYKEKVLTAEALEKAQLMSQKRKQMADEKREKDKKKTMERLLKKQDSKVAKSTKSRQARSTVPMIIYRNTLDGVTLTYPPNVTYPLAPQSARDVPQITPCAICGNPKKYNCSKTNVPLCSFMCYKQNVASIQQIFC